MLEQLLQSLLVPKIVETTYSLALKFVMMEIQMEPLAALEIVLERSMDGIAQQA
jgi:hypothetical protein